MHTTSVKQIDFSMEFCKELEKLAEQVKSITEKKIVDRKWIITKSVKPLPLGMGI